jgi:hypothetical protein
MLWNFMSTLLIWRGCHVYSVFNKPRTYRVGFRTNASSDYGLHDFLAAFHGEPRGGTPLCAKISKIAEEVEVDALRYIQQRQRVAVIIASDGEPTDGKLQDALSLFADLSIWTVILLCTDNEHVVNFWNEIDGEIEIELDVLDEFVSETEEVKQNNPWIYYNTQLHRVREFGVPHGVFDLIDEEEIVGEDMLAFLCGILGGNVRAYIEPTGLSSLVNLESTIQTDLSRQPLF